MAFLIAWQCQVFIKIIKVILIRGKFKQRWVSH